MRYVKEIDEAILKKLREVARKSRNFKERERAKAIILSHKGYSIMTLSDIFEVSRGTITNWLDSWDERGLLGLKDLPKKNYVAYSMAS
jgi:transcriptional antiterminator